MASDPITSWQIDGEKVEAVTDFIFLGSKMTVDSNCSQEIKRCLLLGRKAMTNPDRILKGRDITLSANVHIVRDLVFPVLMYRYDSWTIKKAEELMLLNCGAGEDSCKSLGLQGYQTSQSKRKSSLNIHWKDRCWSWSFNTLATWCERRTDSLEKTLMLGKIEGRRRREWQRMRWLEGITDSMDMNLSKLQEIVKNRKAWCAAAHGIAKSNKT